MQLSPSKVSSRQIPSTTLQDVGGGVTVGGNDVEVGAGCEVAQAAIRNRAIIVNKIFLTVFPFQNNSPTSSEVGHDDE